MIQVKRCRICHSAQLESAVNLGEQFLGGIFCKEKDAALFKKYPLHVVRCADPKGCGLVQLLHRVDPEILYKDYGYQSGINEQMRSNLKDIIQKVESMISFQDGDLVVDIGCNDGTLLTSYTNLKLDKLGFDIAPKIIPLARAKGLEVVQSFFNFVSFEKARPARKAKSVTSIAMFYDLDDPMAFAADVKRLLANDGLWVIEVAYLPFMLQQNSFDTICHEHVEFYALRQIEWILEKQGLEAKRIEFNSINGGSFRLFVGHKGPSFQNSTWQKSLAEARQKESLLKLETDQPFADFRSRIEKLRVQVLKLLTDLKSQGKVVHGYGASTKGSTILQYCKLDYPLITKIADRNPVKWGLEMLGTQIPIVSEEDSRAEKPDFFFVLPWSFIQGFFTREQDFLDRGGKWILPLPELKIVGKENASQYVL